MRTTLTIEDDIAEALKDLARARGHSCKAVVNEALRRGLTTGEKPPASAISGTASTCSASPAKVGAVGPTSQQG